MFRIKICGITSVKDAQLAALAGADAIGLNFYDKSPRCVDLATAGQVQKVLPAKVAAVGIFVNAPADEIRQIADRLELDFVQLHGDEQPEFLARLGELPVVRAFGYRDDGFDRITEYLAQCRQVSRLPAAVLIDAHEEGRYGGTGKVVDWQAVHQHRAALSDIPLVLAGGLTPFNLAQAIAAVRPQAVDVASGVESAPGKKDLLLMRAFCNAARQAFDQLDAAAP